MAFHTRRVKIKALNDSKEIAVIIYINSITLALLAVVEFALNTYHEVYAALFGLGLMVGATLFLTLVFVPKVHILINTNSCSLICLYTSLLKMVNLCKDPKGQTIFSATDQDKKTTLKSSDPAAGTVVNGHHDHMQKDELAVLRMRIAELENKLGMHQTTT